MIAITMYDQEWGDECAPRSKKITSRQKSMARQQEQATGKHVNPLKVARRRPTREDEVSV